MRKACVAAARVGICGRLPYNRRMARDRQLILNRYRPIGEAKAGGFGTVLHFTDLNGKLHTREISQGYTCTTNNRMELLGVITGLEALKRPCTVEVHSDSQYVVNAFNQHWVDGWLKRGWKNSKKEPVKNSDLWKRLLEAKKPHNVSFHWVKGHAGHPENERCDELATTAADGPGKIKDEGFKA